MTFLGLERPVEYQRQQIFDPTTANMVLSAQSDYVNAVYNDYLRGLEDMKEFNKTYGDFMSPIQKDMDWYDKNVTGKVRDFITNAYAQGIDPLRSAEGRAAVSQLIYSMPTGEIAKRKQSAEIAKEYVKNYGALDAAGKLDPNFERFMMNGMSLQDWDTGVNGVWGRYSPSEYKTLQEYVHPSFANIKPHMMSAQEVTDRGYNYDPRYEYTGVSRADMEQSMKDWLPGVRNEGIYRYYREQAKQDLIRRGYKNPTDDQIDAQFVNNAITADHQMMTPLTREVNQFAYLAAKERSEKAVARYKHSLENPGPDQRGGILGLTDKIKNDIREKQSRIGGINTAAKGKMKSVVASAKDYDSAAARYYNTQSKPTDFGQKTITAWFLGFNDPTSDKINDLATEHGYRVNFGPESALHHTRIRMFDYDGKQIGGRIRAFDDYLTRNRVKGYLAGNDRTVNWQKQAGVDVYDVNGVVKINKKDIDGFLEERWQKFKDKTSQSEAQFKRNTMRGLGLVEHVEQDKEYSNPDDEAKSGIYRSGYTTWVYMPVTKTWQLGSVYQSDVDTFNDKNVVSGKELSGRQYQYQVRDINRK